jgi:hypothetical protein
MRIVPPIVKASRVGCFKYHDSGGACDDWPDDFQLAVVVQLNIGIKA